METKVCVFEDKAITFNVGASLMVNANEMAKPFHKHPSKWLELPSTKDFIYSLKIIRKSESLIQTQKGRNGYTWFHEDLALEFARWLSPVFGIWCNDQIKDIIRAQAQAGPTMITLESLLQSPDVLLVALQKLAELKVENAILREDLKATDRNRPSYYPKKCTAADIRMLKSMGTRLGEMVVKMDGEQKILLARNTKLSPGTLRNYYTGNGKKLKTLMRIVAEAEQIVK